MSFKNKLLLDIGIVVFAIVLATTVIWWTGGRIQATVTSVDQLRSDASLRAALLVYLAELRENQEKVKPYLPVINELLPTRENAIGLSRTLQNLAVQHNLQGFSFTFGVEKAGTTAEPGHIAFTFGVSGASSDLWRFLGALETRKGALIKINSFDITLRGDKVSYSLSGSGIAYIR